MHRERVLKALAQLLVGVENKLHLADRRRRREDKLIERARLLEIQRAQNKTNLKDADANGKISYRIGAYMQMKKLEEVYTNRELSWLQFNERVLNEAGNPRVPPLIAITAGIFIIRYSLARSGFSSTSIL